MLKCSRVVLCSLVLNLSIFSLFSLSYADTENNNSNQTNLSVRDLVSSHDIENLFSNSDIIIQESVGSWHKLSVDGKLGWVHEDVFPLEAIKSAQQARAIAKAAAETVKTTEETALAEAESTKVKDGVITGDDVNVRSGPSTGYEVVQQVNSGDKVEVVASDSEWYSVKTQSGVSGWISARYVSTEFVLASRGDTSSSNSSQAVQIIEYARSLLGCKYRYGGTSPSGFDCSGFVQYVFNHFGISLNRVAADQATQGTKISKENLQPGDLVFFNGGSGGKINHVGLYIGNGSFIHASSGSNYKVIISDLNSGSYVRRYVTARRILN